MRFLQQPVAPYRDFQIVFTILTLNFAIPTLSYVFAPALAHQQFVDLNQMLGGAPYLINEPASLFWRYLGAANVAALAFMCAFLQWDLRRNIRVVVPLTFLKSTAATLWLAGFINHPQYPAFLAAAILDYASSAAFVFFAARAYVAINNVPNDGLVPRPHGDRPLEMSGPEITWANALFRRLLPDRQHDTDIIGRVHAMDRLPLSVRFGLRVSIILLTWLPLFVHGQPLHRLEAETAERFVASVGDSRSYLLRQLVEIPKVFLGLAYFADPATRDAV